MLTLQNVTIMRGGKTLIEKLDLTVFENQVIGFIGANGCGKTTLFSVIKGDLESDKGKVELKKNIQIQSLEQETPGLLISALEYTISGNSELYQVFEKLKKAETEQHDEAIMHCHVRLSELDGYSAEARAAKILVGLGFHHDEHSAPVKSFSGGWRMRLNLAKCLFAPSQLLLLDEPTNHLDMEAIIWLENYLKHYQGAILAISHDRDFLDSITTHIAHIENNRLKLYTGNYSTFEIERANAIMLQNAQYQNQQAKIKKMMKFVDRFRSKATKARQAQSRLKMIEKIEKVEPVYERLPFSFHFKDPQSMPNPMITMRNVDIGYDVKIVLQRVNLSITAGQRLGLLGINGAGKSTLIKCMCGELKPIKGAIEKFPGTKIGYFAQHQVDYLPQDTSPFELFREIADSTSERELLNYLGSFNFNRDQALSPIKNFSGGEKARIALALIIWQKPNLLLLDEPTNHIDLEVRQALMLALQEFKGTMILVSHDRFLMRTLVDELLLIKDGKLELFNGSVEDYQQQVS